MSSALGGQITSSQLAELAEVDRFEAAVRLHHLDDRPLDRAARRLDLCRTADGETRHRRSTRDDRIGRESRSKRSTHDKTTSKVFESMK